MAVFQINAGAAFRAETFGLDFANVFAANHTLNYQAFTDVSNQTEIYLSYTDSVSHAALADIISIVPGITLDHSTFDDTFVTPYYQNSALHSYSGVISDFAFHDYSQGAAELVGTLTGQIYDIAITDSYERILTETQQVTHTNTVETFSGLFMGNDQVTLGALADYFCDPQGNLVLHMGGGNDLGVHMLGGNANDTVRIWGGGGNDTLMAQGGHGVLDGGTGADQITAYGGTYDIYGGVGRDSIYTQRGVIHDEPGSAGDAYSSDGGGRVLLTYASGTAGIVADLWTGFVHGAESGNDSVAGIRQLQGSQGDDRLIGMPFGALSEFGVTLWGNTGNDTISGTNQIDLLYGDGGNDRLSGNDGADWLRGGAGDDRLFGGLGDDTLVGGIGRDTMTGDAGADTFLFAAPWESPAATPDRITDFTIGLDRIDLSPIDAIAGTAPNDTFTFVGNAPITGLGQVRMYHTATDTVIEVNTAGTTAPEMRLVLAGLLDVTASDFLL